MLPIKIKKYCNKLSILVLRHIFSRFWHIYLLIGLLSGFSFALQLFGFSLILSSFKSTLNLPFNFEQYFSHLGKFTIISAGFVILVLSSILTFWARFLGAKLMVKYEEICSLKVIERFHQRTEMVRDKNDAQIISLLSKDCRYGGRIIQEICNIIMPLGLLLVAFPVMFYLNMGATILLVIIAFVTIIPFGYIITKAWAISSDFEKAAALDGATKRELLKQIRNDEHSNAILSIPHPDFKRTYIARLIMPHVGILIGGVQLSLCLAAISFFMLSVNKNSTEISTIFIYGLISVMLLRQLMSAAKVFTSFHIFLAYFQRAFEVIMDIPLVTKNNNENGEGSFSSIDDDL